MICFLFVCIVLMVSWCIAKFERKLAFWVHFPSKLSNVSVLSWRHSLLGKFLRGAFLNAWSLSHGVSDVQGSMLASCACWPHNSSVPHNWRNFCAGIGRPLKPFTILRRTLLKIVHAETCSFWFIRPGSHVCVQVRAPWECACACSDVPTAKIALIFLNQCLRPCLV